MAETYDVIVLGVGGFGSGTLYHAARRGLRALGLERFAVGHDRGSSHGESRIIRKAYIEHPDYVPLVNAAYALWSELEDEAGRILFHPAGLLLVGPPAGEAIQGTRLAAEQHHLPIESIPVDEARRRFPGFAFPDESAVMFDPEAGFLEVENCVQAHADCARRRGAVIREHESVLGWHSDGRRVRVRTDRGNYESAALVVTAGAWASQMLAELEIPLKVVRKPSFWFPAEEPARELLRNAPTFYFERPAGHFYGVPSTDGRTVKVAEHTGGVPVDDPLTVDRCVHDFDTTPVAGFVRECLPLANPAYCRYSVCMYTLTPDQHFIVGLHPRFENVAIGAGFSGHGFKFTSVLGAALAELAIDGRTRYPIGFLSPARDVLRPGCDRNLSEEAHPSA